MEILVDFAVSTVIPIPAKLINSFTYRAIVVEQLDIVVAHIIKSILFAGLLVFL